jgi:predicted aspartyl protease
MKLTNLITVRVITPGIMLACMILTSPILGYETHFASGKSALAIPFELELDLIYLRVSVNGSPPLSFILDTGATHSILDPRHAKSFGMKLHQVGKTDLSTEGNPQNYYLIKDKVSLSLPGVVFSNQTLVAVSLDKMQECNDQKRVVDGILGMDFFANLVVEIDYPAQLINVHDPHSYKYVGKGESLRLETDPRNIFVRAQVMGRARRPVTARLRIDTGASVALVLPKQFAETHKLLPPANELTVVDGCNAGGYTQEKWWTGTLEALQLGGSMLSNPSTLFFQRSIARDYDGLLGGSALRNFRVIFDHSRSRMILEPVPPSSKQ